MSVGVTGAGAECRVGREGAVGGEVDDEVEGAGWRVGIASAAEGAGWRGGGGGTAGVEGAAGEGWSGGGPLRIELAVTRCWNVC